MKKTLVVLLSIVFVFLLTGCEKTTYHKLGETISTDLFEFTLDEAQFAIALSNVTDETYASPKEYNPERDEKNPFVAATGHTYAYFSFTIKNISRSTASFGGWGEEGYATVKYNGKKYGEKYNELTNTAYLLYKATQRIDTNNKLVNIPANEWQDSGSLGDFLTNEKSSHRAYIDVPVAINDLTEDVEITINLPNSDGSKTKFTYLVTEEDRNNALK